jgi:putative NIF3 family GTP cyclohydrolase 1 type 2
MKAEELYAKLETDFITSNMKDDWYKHMHDLKELVSENFKKRSMGVLGDFTKEITKVFTAVFPSKEVMQHIIDNDERNAMLLVHHAADWDINKDPVWTQIDRDLLEQFNDRNISIYCLHVPLDNFGNYSTATTLAKALEIKPQRAFGEYHGALCGVITDVRATVEELKILFAEAVGHEVMEYVYGEQEVTKVAVVGGGGNDVDILKEMKELGANTLITGITSLNDHSYEAHEFAKKNKINLLGGTHYSTERFAMQAMENYFRQFKLDTEFIEGSPVKEDM